MAKRLKIPKVNHTYLFHIHSLHSLSIILQIQNVIVTIPPNFEMFEKSVIKKSIENVNIEVVRILESQIANIFNINKSKTVATKTQKAIIDFNSS